MDPTVLTNAQLTDLLNPSMGETYQRLIPYVYDKTLIGCPSVDNLLVSWWLGRIEWMCCKVCLLTCFLISTLASYCFCLYDKYYIYLRKNVNLSRVVILGLIDRYVRYVSYYVASGFCASFTFCCYSSCVPISLFHYFIILYTHMRGFHLFPHNS